MGLRNILIKIRGKDESGPAVAQATSNINEMGRKTIDITKIIKSGWSGVIKILKGVGAAGIASVGLLGAAVKKAFDFETLETQLKVLLGSAEAAKKQFAALRDFSAKTPFQLPGIIDAYQQLLTFTDGALNTKRGLELVGDAAAARGKDFSEMAYWTGRLYSALKNGDPFMDAVGAMQRMGVLGGTIRGDLTAMVESGDSFEKQWAVVATQLERFNGGMAELSQTGGGLMSTLKDNWTIAVATFGNAFMGASKDGIQGMIDTLQKLSTDGTIEEWGQKAKGVLEVTLDIVKALSAGGAEAEKAKARMEKIASAAMVAMERGAERVGIAIASGMIKRIARGDGGSLGRVTGGAVEARTGSKTMGRLHQYGVEGVSDIAKTWTTAGLYPLIKNLRQGAGVFGRETGGGSPSLLKKMIDGINRGADASESIKQDLNK
jgi:hypothetical protein